ncbi:mitochondrial carrier domain-containing protein [Crepidotus variabilis]|uniref:Mitochondrial carrier domain-containing protein n=1 Tax=Crepidotus variabilis TaxID=179855 RepID=A0A9P6JQD6_9AGAR|nr:mitochondrial carrier domain-containing protein [Crepidotus variabilis]
MSSNAGARKDQQSLHYIVRSGLAGGIAGCVAKTVVAPLDRVKILFQASNPDFQKYAGSWRGAFLAGSEIYSRSGLLGLFQGHSATLYRVFPYAAIKFMAYDQFHHALMPTREHETNTRRFMAGAFSGVASVFCTYPLEVIRVRMAFHTRNLNTSTATPIRPSFTYAARFIYREGAAYSETSTSITKSLLDRFPILKFYRGFVVTVIGMVPYAGVSFLSWGYLRSRFLPPSKVGHRKATPMADLAIGAISGAVGQTASYPLEVVRRRMQVGGITRPDRWIKGTETVRTIYQSSGWRGFFVGLSLGYLKVVPMTAVSFAVWQGCKRLLDV